MNILTEKILNDIFENDNSERAFNRFKLYQVEVDECYVDPQKQYFMKRSDGLWILFFNPHLFKPSLLESIRQEINQCPHLYSGHFTVELTQLFALGDYDNYPETFNRLKDNADEYIKRYYRYGYDK